MPGILGKVTSHTMLCGFFPVLLFPQVFNKSQLDIVCLGLCVGKLRGSQCPGWERTGTKDDQMGWKRCLNQAVTHVEA
jgi:hypothetical protein